MKKISPTTESGSALVYILLAVALFAALSFAISNMFSGGQSSSEKELAKMATSEMLQFSNNLKRAIQEMKIDGVDYSEISFENNTLEGYENENCTNEDCKIFSPSGGNVVYQKPERDWLADDEYTERLFGEWYFPAQICATMVGSDRNEDCDSDVDDNEDVIAILPWVKKSVCVGVNKQLGVDNPDGNPPKLNNGGWDNNNPKFIGETGDGTMIDVDGRRVGCFEGAEGRYPPAGTYHFYQVLWGR
jgi:hypothetical protein